MPIGSTALINLIVILIIGAVAGLGFNLYGRSWLSRLGSSKSSDVTAALVGIAGAFIGFHISVILGLLPSHALRLGSHWCPRRSVALARTLRAARNCVQRDFTADVKDNPTVNSTLRPQKRTRALDRFGAVAPGQIPSTGAGDHLSSRVSISWAARCVICETRSNSAAPTSR